MKSLITAFLALILFTTANAQFPGYTLRTIQIEFGDLLEQEKWDFDKEYRWSFYICADDVEKLTAAQEELVQLGFTNFEIIPNSVSRLENGEMLNMLSFEKSTKYLPQTLMDDITAFYNLEKNYNLSSFDDYGNYELLEEIQPSHETATNTKNWKF